MRPSELRGLEQNIILNKLKNITPLEQKQNDMLLLTDQTIDNGNMGRVKSDYVYRKVRSEALSKNVRHADDIIDLHLMQQDNQNYLRLVGSRLHVEVYNEEQLHLLELVQNSILYIDAIGSIIRRPEG
ncbi:hypothetical protein QE152_g15513 [Popillia japonica]|uniref:Uncharacterized protein n=1 Tax=Popillia japonica TaxID=7064 RepID=A0AAW1L889_POPJA